MVAQFGLQLSVSNHFVLVRWSFAHTIVHAIDVIDIILTSNGSHIIIKLKSKLNNLFYMKDLHTLQ